MTAEDSSEDQNSDKNSENSSSDKSCRHRPTILNRTLSTLPKFPNLSKESIVKAFNRATLARARQNEIEEKNWKNYELNLASVDVQHFGVLLKKVRKKNRAPRWVKRFCVLKEGFILYYSENEFKEFIRKCQFNNRPRGVISLGGCMVEPFQDVGHKFSIEISGDFLKVPVILSAISETDQDKWITVLREATKITLKNAQLGEEMIRELETQGMRLHKEKQLYVDKLQTEATALRDEIDKNEELERVRLELQFEKAKLEQTAKELKDDLQIVRQELHLMQQTKETLEQEKLNLNGKTQHLQAALEGLEMEKNKIEEQLTAKDREREHLSKEYNHLSQTTCNLKNELSSIEQQTAMVLQEKAKIEQQLRENMQRAVDLEEEKEYYSVSAKELMASLNDLAVQKEMTEAELKDEVLARLAAEKQLNSAETALKHLELALRLSGTHMTEEMREQILPDVHKLKKFFEECAEDARLDADRPLIMKNAVYARKSFLRKSRTKIRSSTRRSGRYRVIPPDIITSEPDNTTNVNIHT